MARPKSLLVSMNITVAGNSHNCRHSDNHRILKGASRLTINTDDGPKHYCLKCADSFLMRDVERIQALLHSVKECLSSLPS